VHPKDSTADWHLIPGAPFKDSSRSFLLDSSPLLEEKRDFDSQALISDISDPFLHDRSCAGTRLAAHNGMDTSLDKEKFFLPEEGVMALQFTFSQA
jgi:hypothetical protein